MFNMGEKAMCLNQFDRYNKFRQQQLDLAEQILCKSCSRNRSGSEFVCACVFMRVRVCVFLSTQD